MTGQRTTSARVLVVDDDPSLAENLNEIVAGLGGTARVVATGSAALACTAEETFDLALVDVRLPDGDGVELIPRIRERSPLTEVVLITGDATVESAIGAVRRGAFAYVLKPFSPADLADTIRRAFAQVEIQRDRERLRSELERSERHHREVVDAVPAFVLALDGDGRIAIWNRRLEDVTGFSRAEMLGKRGGDLVEGEGVLRLPLKGGGERLVRWQRADLASDGKSWTYAVGIDVTAEQEMLARTLRAERLAAVGTLAAGLAHEVRNPLNSANLQLTVLERRVDRGECRPDAIRPVTAVVREEIQRLDRLVNDFLAFARPRPLDRQPVDLNEMCRGVLRLMVHEAEAAKIQMNDDLAASLPRVLADGERLRQVLVNLVRNAVEAMSGGGRLLLRTRVAGSSHVEIDVEDSGPGFPADAPVFDAFFTTKPHGTGLGLSIVHRIVSDHGGTIRIRSGPGSTCCTVSLPVDAP